MANPVRYCTVYNQQQFISEVNKLNGNSNVYTTVYAFEKLKENEYGNIIPDFQTAIIDKVFFDFDGFTSFENVNKLHKYLVEKNIRHTMFFTGNGFHLYVFTNSQQPKFKKDSMLNYCHSIASELKMTIGPNTDMDIDSHPAGDVSRITRVPYTKNVKKHTMRWCIPISHTDLRTSFDAIANLAAQDNCVRLKCRPRMYGKELLDLSEFDYERDNGNSVEDIEIPESDVGLECFGEEHLWPCVSNMLTKRSGNKAWFWAIIWLKHWGYSKNDVQGILKKYLSKWKRTDGTHNDFFHAVNSDKLLDCVFNGDKHWFPRCETIFRAGYCKKKCEWYDKIYCKKY